VHDLININMNDDTNNIKEDQQKNSCQDDVPNENSTIAVLGNIKIFDPDTKEIFVNIRL
jgi:hypothetical protein